MFRAFSLIESITTLTLFVIAFYFISPSLFQFSDKIKLNNEIEQIKSFVYQIQSQARYTKQNYSLSISQPVSQKFCLIAVKKESSKQIPCDCFNLSSCTAKEYQTYYSQNSNVILRNRSLYPRVFMNIDGVSAKLESKCINMRLNDESEILQFDQNGVIYVMPKAKRSSCRE
ncbi:Type II secretory pathway, pseudopilin PulG [Haemophilus paracuniculus]|uniref:Type II secretory pathway, pseudopilin PulG n=1 Tax=Haemophilus paracuniculus TaxID=734 RepID=A0A1T0AQ82_9PAST|nr:type II secretion system protein [Haemophilus paracuniculus]OOR98327.1 Type II secretory pathway, pseudopilin PulG [Haemophilus paracuniculus]